MFSIVNNYIVFHIVIKIQIVWSIIGLTSMLNAKECILRMLVSFLMKQTKV